MKSLHLFKTLVLGCVLAGAANAGSLDWSTGTTYPPYLKYLTDANTAGMSFESTFANLTGSDGVYDPNTMVITSARATFYFADDKPDPWFGGDADEYVDIFIDNVVLISNQEVDGSHPESSFAPYSAALTEDMLAALQDGTVSYRVQLINKLSGTREDTYLKKVKLEAFGEYKTHNVPESASTSALIAFAFAGLLALGKRFGRAA